jgi:hypothetical protein
MTDRHAGYVVTLEANIREDDATAIMDALKMVRGVLDVRPVAGDVMLTVAEARARRDMQDKFYSFYVSTFQWETSKEGSRP